MKYKIAISSFEDGDFVVSQFATEREILVEKITFSNANEINETNYDLFHDDSVCLKTIFIKKNELINILNYGMNIRRLVCLWKS